MVKTILFSRSLYREDALLAAAQAYAGFAEISVKPHENDCEVVISVEDPSHFQQILDHFSNHALFETILRHRNPTGDSL